MESAFVETAAAIDEFVKEYDCLNRVMTRDGYMAVIDNVLRGNHAYLKLVHEAIDSYIEFRDMAKLMQTLDKPTLAILNFAYINSKNQSNYYDIIKKIITFRKYHELTRYEEECKNELALLVDFPNITSRIYKLKEQQLEVSYKLCAGKKSLEYRKYYEEAPDAKDYLYQISKDKKLWPIRQTMEKYSDFILPLFPCFLLSPENVSAILPLKRNMFDLVIFDEASQVFIESTIPAIYRGQNIVVAGDAKQLRPSTAFIKRYLGQDYDEDDEAIQAALEVDSLLDLAVARYESANLNYHYRSRNEELIAFSNTAFYSSKLQVAPNISANKKSRPIERYKVDGKWIDRCNPVEAEKVVEVLKKIFKTRKNNESIGIITFNSEQQSCIADKIDEAARADGEFRSFMNKERYRQTDGEDTGIFIKNLENVQGDERDIIIFSIGYAQNEQGRVYTSFGSLSSEGGENRLNVAITRAKSKIIVVTSIEPEELRVDGAKNAGPRLLREYLAYVRAVSASDDAHARDVLRGIAHGDGQHALDECQPTDALIEIKAGLEKKGYTVHTGLGNKNSRISLAVYDEASDRYLVGVELECDAFASSNSALERDVYKPKFLEARGWTIMRVWSRDIWLSPVKVVNSIIAAAEKNR
jgi:superfamily I DNA and/or RNA helicase